MIGTDLFFSLRLRLFYSILFVLFVPLLLLACQFAAARRYFPMFFICWLLRCLLLSSLVIRGLSLVCACCWLVGLLWRLAIFQCAALLVAMVDRGSRLVSLTVGSSVRRGSSLFFNVFHLLFVALLVAGGHLFSLCIMCHSLYFL